MATSDWFRSRTSPTPVTGNGSAGSTAATAAQPTVTDGWAIGKQPTSGTDGWAIGKHAAQIIAEPVRGDLTAAGLPSRVPQANLIPGSATGGRVAGGPVTGGGATSRPGSGAEAPAPTAPRSPDLARSRLSGFQRGARRAKGLSPSAPDSPEGADR